MTEIAWPFLLQAGQSQQKFNGQRLIEAVLIAVVTAGGTSYASKEMVAREFESIEKRLMAHELALMKSQDALHQIEKVQASRESSIQFVEKLRDRNK